MRARHILFFVLCLALAPLAPVLAQPADSSSTPDESAAPAMTTMSARDAFILGVVEGVTEYLPVSSTGHLIIANHFLGLESEQPLQAADGTPLWHRRPSASHPEGEPLTQKLAADTFVVIVQFGAIAAVALLYWPRLLSMLWGLLGRDPVGLRLLVNLLIAFIPAAALGFLLNDWIDENLFSVRAVIAALAAGAVLMLLAEFWRKRWLRAETAEFAELTPRKALLIGAMQCLALWPGTSRSMTTILGGYFAGLPPKRAAEFSFLLGLVTLSAATAYKGLKSGPAMIAVFGWAPILLGCVVAAVTAALSVRFLVTWLGRHGLAAFAWYRLALAAVLLLLLPRV